MLCWLTCGEIEDYNRGMYDAKRFGNNVLLARRDSGIKQEVLADVAGVSRAYITNIEAGRGDNVGVAVIFRIADALGVTVPYLLGLEDSALGEPEAAVLREQAGEYLAVDVESREQRRVLQQVVDLFAGMTPEAQAHALRYLLTVRKMDDELRRKPTMDENEVEMWASLLERMDAPAQRTIRKRSVGVEPDASSAQ